eukprot:3175210-Rhodomonas_salina.1
MEKYWCRCLSPVNARAVLRRSNDTFRQILLLLPAEASKIKFLENQVQHREHVVKTTSHAEASMSKVAKAPQRLKLLPLGAACEAGPARGLNEEAARVKRARG